MKVFLDTNILLDVLLERAGYEDALALFQLQDEGKLSLCMSLLTMVNVAYVYKKTVGQNTAVANVKYLSSFAEVLPMDETQLQQALMMDGPDFEDNLQAACASACECEWLITRNVKDYRIKRGLAGKLSLPSIATPASFLASFL